MEPKTEWGNPQIFIQNGDNWEPLEAQPCNSFTVIEESPTLYDDLCRAFKKISLSFTLANVQMRKWMEVFGVDGRKLPAIRFRTGIAPRRGRTRRKQRLTRLQRRHKRQTKTRRKA